MVSVLFVCHGNICRSPMAEFVFRDLVTRAGLESWIQTRSAATSREEIGSGVHPGTRKRLAQAGIAAEGKRAVQLRREDYDQCDYILGMDRQNMQAMTRLFGGDPAGKVSLLLDYAGGQGAEIADPWYTGDFERTYRDVLAGCEGVLAHICRNDLKKP